MKLKSFKDWRIATKLSSIIVLLLILQSAIGFFGLFQSKAINQRVVNLYSQELIPLKIIGEIKSSFYRVRDRVGRHLKEGERQRIHERKIQEQIERIDQKKIEYRQTRLSDEEIEYLDEYKKAWVSYLLLIEKEVLPLSRSGDIPNAEKKFYGPALVEFRQARDAINKLQNYQIKRAKLRFQNSKIAYQKMRKLTLFVVFLSIIIAGFIGFRLIRSITLPVNEIHDVINHLDNGDLTQSVKYSSNDEIGQMAYALNNSLASQRQMISQVAEISEQLASSGEEMAAITDHTSQAVHDQRKETEFATNAMKEMTLTVRDVAENINQTAASAEKANEQTLEGARVVEKAIEEINILAEQINTSAIIINEVEQHSEGISKVLEVIQGIAEQTNLLALNAAIEAARAGEQGRGFAVVADEVRTLAGRTQESTSEINEMIEKLQEGSRRAVEVMEQSRKQSESSVKYATKSGAALSTIANAVEQINSMSYKIAAAAEEQSTVSEDVSRNIAHINDMATQTAEGAGETSIASKELARLASELQGLINQFQV